MAFLMLNCSGVKKIKKEFGLGNCIARGMFSAVFDSPNPNRIYKMTACDAHYNMLCDEQFGVTSDYFPKVFQDFGLVGLSVNGCYPEDPLVNVYLIEMERLTKIGARSTKTTFLRDAAHVGSMRTDMTCEGFEIAADWMLERSAPPAGLDVQGYADAYRQLGGFLRGFNLGKKMTVDLHGANFMKRHDGTIVLSDPVAML